MKNNLVLATLNLFNAVPVLTDNRRGIEFADAKRMLSNGYFCESSISLNDSLMKIIEERVGIGGAKLNATFHKSWKKVANAPYIQLLIEQLVHYISVYGLGQTGNTMYIPTETFDIPELDVDKFPVIIIRGMTPKDLFESVVKLGSSGMALSDEAVNDIMTIVSELDFGEEFGVDFVESIKNNQLLARLYEHFGVAPKNPVAWLRYVVYILTGETLLIKNRKLFAMISTSSKGDILDKKLLNTAPDNLASIFNRFKPLFLAMKKLSSNKTFFNNLRKQAYFMHEPLEDDYLNTITAQLRSDSLSWRSFSKALSAYPVWRKIRLAYAIKDAFNNEFDFSVYRVRNGKVWVGNSNPIPASRRADVEKAFTKVLESIVSDMQKNVEGLTFYIPSFMHYSVPSTQKAFSGNIPANSFINGGRGNNVLIGVHWYNVNSGNTDIDLSALDSNGYKIGWNSGWRDGAGGNARVLYSGDVTSAPRPHGASEFLWFKDNFGTPKVISLNNFSRWNNEDIPYQLIIGYETPSSFGKNYMINPSNVLVNQSMTIKDGMASVIPGLISSVDGENRFYFVNFSDGDMAVSYGNDRVRKIKEYTLHTALYPIELNDLLVRAGANVVNERPETGDYVDLSPEKLDKLSFINMFS